MPLRIVPKTLRSKLLGSELIGFSGILAMEIVSRGASAPVLFGIFAFGTGVMVATIRLLRKVKRLEGLIPVCAYCRNIRTEEKHWIQWEQYVAEKSDAQFSHGICPECAREQFPELYDKKQQEWSEMNGKTAE